MARRSFGWFYVSSFAAPLRTIRHLSDGIDDNDRRRVSMNLFCGRMRQFGSAVIVFGLHISSTGVFCSATVLIAKSRVFRPPEKIYYSIDFVGIARYSHQNRALFCCFFLAAPVCIRPTSIPIHIFTRSKPFGLLCLLDCIFPYGQTIGKSSVSLFASCQGASLPVSMRCLHIILHAFRINSK